MNEPNDPNRPDRPEEPRVPPAEPGERRSSQVLPVLLIVAGVALLLGRIGVFDWSAALGILEMWPLLLIALGADILTRGRYRLGIVIAAVVLGALFYRAPGWVPGMGGGPAEVHEIAYERDDARAAEIDLRHGVGTLVLSALPADSDLIVGGEIGTGRRETLGQEFRIRNGVADLRIESRQRGPSFDVGGGERRTWSLALTRDVPVDLEIDSGVGESELGLRDLTLTGFDLDAGVGEVRVTLPDEGGYEGSIESGVGEVVLRIPRGVEARLEIDTGLGDVDVNGEWLRDGDVHTTPGYARADAEDRIAMRIDGGVGPIRVDRID